MKIKELFLNSIKLLEDKGIDTASLDVKMLLSFLLNSNTNDLINSFEKDISYNFSKRFDKLIIRRLNREPIANIIGTKFFWDYEFIVNKNVLTPRPDSETLIEAVLKNYTNKNKKLNIMDLGTGSGCLILTLLKTYQNAYGLAVDRSKKALNIARKNANNLCIKRIKFLQNNWNNGINDKFDLIISNPPYISKNDIKILGPEVNIFNPILALDGGDDGLDCYKYLAKNLKKNCKNDTKIFLEIGKNQENDIQKIFENENFTLENFYKDINQITRILCFIIIVKKA
ncbi:MAG: peptide chain release factor N(5)-glutamine methyltransferase [Rickettsiales bacterium]|nr:peptide chain release factor N(5)-glutamine methyltransferase [Rickettsiales bacterium]